MYASQESHGAPLPWAQLNHVPMLGQNGASLARMRWQFRHKHLEFCECNCDTLLGVRRLNCQRLAALSLLGPSNNCARSTRWDQACMAAMVEGANASQQ